MSDVASETHNPFEFWYHHAGVSVANLDASVAWYRDVLGFTLLRQYFVESIPGTIAMMANGPLHVELFELKDAVPLPPDRREPNLDLRTHGNKHISFAVRDIETFANELKRRNADIVWVKHFAFGSNAFIRDNSGNLIEFVQNTAPATMSGSL